MIFAEFSLGFDTAADCEDALRGLGVDYRDIPFQGLSYAGRAFQLYRRRGGVRSAPLPDFFIGGHASAIQAPILTRDAARYQAYFPDVALLAPK